jgi:hypothetical protein
MTIISMNITPLQTLSDDSIVTLFQNYFCETTAYAILGSTHGYSLSELRSEIKNPPTHKEDYAFVDIENNTPVGVLRIDQRDHAARSLRLMLDIQKNTPPLYHSLCLSQKLDHLREETPELKLYSYLLAHEDNGKALLTSLQFQREAVLDEQVFANGRYYDLEIWGTQRKTQP